jgi:flavin-dependent dehydrogenase
MHFFGEEEPSVMQGAHIAEGLVRFGLGASLRLKLGSGMKPEAFFWQRLRGYPQLEARLRAARVVRPAYARARLGYRTVAIARSGLLLVGDATGYLNPILGDGILMALRSAELASEVAVQAFAHRDFSMKQLAVYERRWRWTRWPRVAIGRTLIAMHRRPQVVDRLGHVTSLRRMLLNTLMRP